VIIGRQQEMEIIDQQALLFNGNLRVLRIASCVMAAFGLLLFACALALPAVMSSSVGLSRQGSLSALNSDERMYVTVDRLTDKTPEGESDDLIMTMTAIPALEKIRSVQPQREPNQSVITGSGLTVLNN
jgi:hypothetical protein